MPAIFSTGSACCWGPHEGGLAGSVLAHDAEVVALIQFKIQISDQGPVAVAQGQIHGGKKCHKCLRNIWKWNSFSDYSTIKIPVNQKDGGKGGGKTRREGEGQAKKTRENDPGKEKKDA